MLSDEIEVFRLASFFFGLKFAGTGLPLRVTLRTELNPVMFLSGSLFQKVSICNHETGELVTFAGVSTSHCSYVGMGGGAGAGAASTLATRVSSGAKRVS